MFIIAFKKRVFNHFSSLIAIMKLLQQQKDNKAPARPTHNDGNMQAFNKLLEFIGSNVSHIWCASYLGNFICGGYSWLIGYLFWPVYGFSCFPWRYINCYYCYKSARSVL